MKKGELLVVVLGLGVLLAAAAFSVEAPPFQTNPCGTCHVNTGVLILSSNATGTVNATVGVPFVLIVNQTGYVGGDGRVAIGLRPDWPDNMQFSFVEQGVKDGDVSDLNPTADQVTVSFTLTPLTEGSWTVRIWTAGAQGMIGTSLDISVSVSDATTTSTTSPTTSTNTSLTTQPGDFTLLTLALPGGSAIILVIIFAYLIKKSREPEVLEESFN